MKRSVVLAGPLTLALLLAACGDDPQARFARAQEAFDARDYRAAQVDLAAALAGKPGDPAMLVLQARTALALGDGVAAQAALDKLPAGAAVPDRALLHGEAALLREQGDVALAAVEGETSAEAHRIRALAQLMAKDRAAAATSFEAGLSADGNKARLMSDYARFALQGGDIAKARKLADAALKAEPKGLDPLLVDARVAELTGDLARALAGYDKAVAGYPGNLAALTGKAQVLGALGRTKEMAEVVATARAGAPTDLNVIYLEARLAAAAKDWGKARDLLQANEAKLASRDDAMVLYGQALSALGQHEQARARLAPVVRRSPAHRLARRTLAEAQLAGGDAKGALETMRPVADGTQGTPEDYALATRAAERAGDAAAARYAARAIYPTPQSLAALLAEGDAAIKGKDWPRAIAAYERILSVTDGKNAVVLNNLAYAQAQVGNRERALEMAERAFKNAPQNPSVMDTLGWLLVDTGKDRARGLALLRQAAQKAPGNATIRSHLQAAEKQQG